MCNRKDENEKVSVGVVMDKTNRPDPMMHSEGHRAISTHFITDTSVCQTRKLSGTLGPIKCFCIIVFLQ